MPRVANELKDLAAGQECLHKLPVAKEGAKNHAREERGLIAGVAVHQLGEKCGVKPDILHNLCGHLFGQVWPKESAADVHHILPNFELQARELRQELHRQIGCQELLEHVELVIGHLHPAMECVRLRILGQLLEQVQDDKKMIVNVLPKLFCLCLRLRRARAGQQLYFIRQLLHCIPWAVLGRLPCSNWQAPGCAEPAKELLRLEQDAHDGRLVLQTSANCQGLESLVSRPKVAAATPASCLWVAAPDRAAAAARQPLQAPSAGRLN
mmetsp:Transcript_112914/g.269041  ORF Transcript_112914/g.269041 Transcript_112914/m.269041 type:complete len:267 (-) Transcript_112914:49-849(-)